MRSCASTLLSSDFHLWFLAYILVFLNNYIDNPEMSSFVVSLALVLDSVVAGVEGLLPRRWRHRLPYWQLRQGQVWGEQGTLNIPAPRPSVSLGRIYLESTVILRRKNELLYVSFLAWQKNFKNILEKAFFYILRIFFIAVGLCKRNQKNGPHARGKFAASWSRSCWVY